MKTKQKIKIILQTLVLPAVFIFSCVEFEPVSPIPEVEYLDFELIDGYDSALGNKIKLVILEFNFIDGDADFGVEKSVWNDISQPDSVRFNLFMTVYSKIDGIYAPKVFWNDTAKKFDTLVLNNAILHDERMDRVGQNKTIKGKITSNTQLTQWQELNDTFRVEFYIRDRYLNKSNLEYTKDYKID